VTIKHLYDEDGGLSGHMVTAEHEPDTDAKPESPGSSYVPSPPDIETPHETYDSAEAKAREHHNDNVRRFGKKPKGSDARNSGGVGNFEDALKRKFVAK